MINRTFGGSIVFAGIVLSAAFPFALGVALAGSALYSTSGSSLDGPPSIFVFDALKGNQTPKQVVSGPYLALPIGVAVGP